VERNNIPLQIGYSFKLKYPNAQEQVLDASIRLELSGQSIHSVEAIPVHFLHV